MTTPTEFAERCGAVAAELALFYAGEPDEKVALLLAALRTNIQAELAKIFAAGADIPAAVDLFIEAILSHKHEIEASALGGPKPN
jgi:hypothetical protein